MGLGQVDQGLCVLSLCFGNSSIDPDWYRIPVQVRTRELTLESRIIESLDVLDQRFQVLQLADLARQGRYTVRLRGPTTIAHVGA